MMRWLVALLLMTRALHCTAIVNETIASHQLNREIVYKVYTHDPRLLCASASVHGHMNKVQRPSLDVAAEGRSRKYYKAGVPIFTRMKVYISLKYKFIYIRQPKSSSSAILFAISVATCGHHPGGCTDPDSFKLMWSTDISDATWQSFYVFTVVRNPWTRMASAFHFLESRHLHHMVSKEEGPGARCKGNFTQFALDPRSLIQGCKRNKCCAYIHEMQDWNHNFIQLHISDQAHGVFRPDGLSVVDYIGRTEHVNEDWREILQSINNRSGASMPFTPVSLRNPVLKPVPTSAPEVGLSCLSDRYYDLYKPETMAGVARYYAVDIIRFGFLDGVPEDVKSNLAAHAQAAESA